MGPVGWGRGPEPKPPHLALPLAGRGASLGYGPREVPGLGLGEPLSLGQDSCHFPSSCLDHTGQERKQSPATLSLGFSRMETRCFCLLSRGLRLSASRLNQMGITGVCVRGRGRVIQNYPPTTNQPGPQCGLVQAEGFRPLSLHRAKERGWAWVTVLPPSSLPYDMWKRVEETPQPSRGSSSDAWKTSGLPWRRRHHSYPSLGGGGGAGNSCYNK